MNQSIERIKVGILDENPVLVQVLGMCPTLAVTTSAQNGLGMGLATTAVLIGSNFVISLLRKLIPAKVRIPAFIVIIATFVTMIDLLLHAQLPSLHESLGLFIPLIVVNCIVLGRAEGYASKTSPLLSVMDGIGMGLGFSLALTVLGAVRELLGAGQVFGLTVLPASIYTPMTLFILAPGAFIVLGFMFAAYNHLMAKAKSES